MITFGGLSLDRTKKRWERIRKKGFFSEAFSPTNRVTRFGEFSPIG
jgi:hypothetical protein